MPFGLVQDSRVTSQEYFLGGSPQVLTGSVTCNYSVASNRVTNAADTDVSNVVL